ncbi:NUDIX domain-containing protein [Azoarcus sp. TTM-91]|uniref:NUDIX domain-containing protein n=1 Tax=Azoarcus sp. TTM-91 TaxID=2691581 RepID=UPI00145F94EF|nr:NUDIX domain-containing protein [Azoarcus sp. TTM-91]NMG34770.1 NUDIX domain-containing protein [Azoarcus sp. TTM-91]
MNFCPQCATPLAPRQVDELQRLACPAPGCGFVHWDNPTPVVLGLVETEAGFILARNALWPPEVFSLISGFIEREETPEQTILRETREELGLAASRADFIGHYTLEKRNQLIIAYALRASGVPQPNHELAELRLLSRAELAGYDFGRLALSARIVGDWLARGPHRS